MQASASAAHDFRNLLSPIKSFLSHLHTLDIDNLQEAEVKQIISFLCTAIQAAERAEKLAEKYGAIKAVRLEVAGAFHTEMMSSAAKSLGEALSNCEISEPSAVKTIANINAEYYQTSEKISDGLINQLTCPILWQKCMERLISDGVDKYYEIGPGRVLTGLMRRINRKIRVVNVSTLQAIEELL